MVLLGQKLQVLYQEPCIQDITLTLLALKSGELAKELTRKSEEMKILFRKYKMYKMMKSGMNAGHLHISLRCSFWGKSQNF